MFGKCQKFGGVSYVCVLHARSIFFGAKPARIVRYVIVNNFKTSILPASPLKGY